jgi:hypothetical protein
VTERNVDGGAGRRDLARRRDDRLAAADRRAHGLAHLRVQDRRRMLDLAVHADDRRFAVCDRRPGKERRHLGREPLGDLGAQVEHRAEILDVTAGERIRDDRDADHTRHLARRITAAVGADRLARHEYFASFHRSRSIRHIPASFPSEKYAS